MVDLSSFLNQTIQGENPTKIIRCPEGTFSAQISPSVEDMGWQEGESTKDGNTRKWYMLNLTWNILDQGVLSQLKRDKVNVKQTIFVDLDATGGIIIDDDKNVGLGKLRRAIGQNTPDPWSPARLVGAGPALVQVKSRPNPNDPTDPFVEVVSVNPMA